MEMENVEIYIMKILLFIVLVVLCYSSNTDCSTFIYQHKLD